MALHGSWEVQIVGAPDLAAGGRAGPADEQDLRRQVESVLAQVKSETAAGVCELFVREPGSGDLLLAVFTGSDKRAFQQITRFRTGEGIPGLVAECALPVHCSDLGREGRFRREAVKEKGYSSYTAVPVRAGEDLAGCLGAAFRRPVDPAAVLPVLLAAAERLGLIFELHGLRARALIADFSFDPGRDGQGNLEAALSRILQRLVHLAGADGGVISLLDPSSGVLRVAETQGTVRHLCRIAAGGEAAETCCIAGGGRCMAYFRRGEEVPPVCRALMRGCVSVACLPLRAGDRLYGIAILGYGSDGPAAIERLVFLPGLARQAMQVLRSAYAVLELERRGAARESERVRADLGAFIARSLEPVVTRAGAVTALAGMSPGAVRPELVSLSTMLRESLATIENRLSVAVPATVKQAGTAAAPPPVPAGESGHLDIRCFGRLTILRDGQPVPLSGFQRKRALQMLKVLLTNYGRPVSRDTLIDILWPDAEPARGAMLLKVAAHYLRKGLEPDAPSGRASRFIITVGDGYMFNPDSPHRLDWKEFLDKCHLGERLIDQGDRAAGLTLLRTAADLYAGDYLEEEVYSDWSMRLREHLRQKFLAVVQLVAGLCLEEGDAEGAVAYYRRALEVDPAQEALHRELMRVLYRLGRRDEALRQYRICRQALVRELGANPLPETEELYRRIAGGDVCCPA